MAAQHLLAYGLSTVKLSYTTVAFLSVVGLVLSQLFLACYRLFLHPLSNFPGPKLAAATYWYEFYYDVPKKGVYLWKIKDLHDRYGEILNECLFPSEKTAPN